MKEETYFATLDGYFYIKYKGNVYPFKGEIWKEFDNIILSILRGNYHYYTSTFPREDELIWLTYNEIMLLGFS